MTIILASTVASKLLEMKKIDYNNEVADSNKN